MAREERPKGTGSIFRRSDRGPWIGAWYDWDGRRKVKSTRTTDRLAAERILAKWVGDAALRREGVIDPTQDRHLNAGRRLLTEHTGEYLAQLRRAGLNGDHIDMKRHHLERFTEVTGAARLMDLTPDAVERYLAEIKATGRSARTVNFARQQLVAFVSWCVRTGRVAANALKTIPKQDETTDRRRVRRPLTEAELASLFAVAQKHGRGAWYLTAALAGLRRGDLVRLVWTDVNFTEGILTIRGGKSRRIDLLPLHPQLREALQAHRAASMSLPGAKVFPTAVTNLTRTKDFLRAGIYRREVVIGPDGKPVMFGEGKRRRAKTVIVTTDADGRTADLHALRMTLGTQLARAGVAPQIAQKVLRHTDYRTTLKHYTSLALADSAGAITKVPSVGTPAARVAANAAP